VLDMTLQRSWPDQADALGVAEHTNQLVVEVGHHHAIEGAADG